MVSQGYRDWLAASRPYALIRPARALQVILRGHGLTVYDFPNDAHLQADTPEDHTPFSVTGWPDANRRWKARAVDVMPRGGVLAAASRKENADIARQLIRDRDGGVSGVMWIKYLNWTDENGVCRQERWTDSAHPLARTTRSSTDKGHIHISGRSDVDVDARADTYDPIARMNGDDVNLTDPLSQPLFSGEEGLPPATTTQDNGKSITIGQAIAFAQQDAHYAREIAKQTRDEVRELAEKLGTPVDGEVLEAVPYELSDADVDRIAEATAAKLAARLAS